MAGRLYFRTSAPPKAPLSRTYYLHSPFLAAQVDDDVYLQPQRLLAASLQWSEMGAGAFAFCSLYFNQNEIFQPPACKGCKEASVPRRTRTRVFVCWRVLTSACECVRKCTQACIRPPMDYNTIRGSHSNIGWHNTYSVGRANDASLSTAQSTSPICMLGPDFRCSNSRLLSLISTTASATKQVLQSSCSVNLPPYFLP